MLQKSLLPGTRSPQPSAAQANERKSGGIKMAQRYEELKYTRTQIKRAGKIYISDDSTEQQKEEALMMINNWRAAHSFPLQVLYVHVKKVAPENAIVAQRLKRLYSITQKLHRFPHMSLTTMQDIGGCRVIVDTLDQVYQMVERLRKSRMRHGKSTMIILKIQRQMDTAAFTRCFRTLVRKILNIMACLLKCKSEHTFNIFGQQQ